MGISASIIINTLNRAKTLKQTLLSIRGIDYDRFEVIVVKGPCSDGTDKLLSDFADIVKIVSCPDANLSRSRNIGIEHAAGDVVAFIDDDAIPHPKWLQQLMGHYADVNIGGVGGFTIDNTGVRFQVCKTICDRNGKAFSVSSFFDERTLNFPGTPYYPSLLGTNSSFRRKALEDIGGFDHTFAYYLDETDVCLRIVDAGYKIMYEPEALVFHQYAPSGMRTARRIHKTLFNSVKSKTYFIMRHGVTSSIGSAADELQSYERELMGANKWHLEHGEITSGHKASLDRDVRLGIQEGTLAALSRGACEKADLATCNEKPTLMGFPQSRGLRIALVSRGFPPNNETGISRWVYLLARSLAHRGNQVHVITEAIDSQSTIFDDGIWIHRIKINTDLGQNLQADLDIPIDIASWSAAVAQEVSSLKSFGLQVVSAPIWDLEGIALLDRHDLLVVTSLHTTYALAKEFKIEWRLRPLHEYFHVTRVVRAERRLFSESPLLLTNSEAIVDDLRRVYNCEPSLSLAKAVHGTPDPLMTRRRSVKAGYLRVTFVGRFEARKGFDIAAKVFARVLNCDPNVQCVFAGDIVSSEKAIEIKRLGADILLTDSRVKFAGLLSREQLDDLYTVSDIVLMPSRYESFGLVAIEAMAAGCVVIALSAGGLKEVITNGVSGYLVPQDGNEVDTCFRNIMQLIDDKDVLETMKRNARINYESHFTIDIMGKQVEDAFAAAFAKWRK